MEKKIKLVIKVTCTEEYYETDMAETKAQVISGEFAKKLEAEKGVHKAIVTFEEIID